MIEGSELVDVMGPCLKGSMPCGGCRAFGFLITLVGKADWLDDVNEATEGVGDVRELGNEWFDVMGDINSAVRRLDSCRVSGIALEDDWSDHCETLRP